MAEPEDLVLDGAYVASRFVRDFRRRHAPAAAATARLALVRQRVELFLHALFGREIRIAATETSAPVSWMGRLAGLGSSSRRSPTPANDGVRIYLPATLECSADQALERFSLLAVQQGVRILRGSAAAGIQIEDDDRRWWFALAEAVAVDAWMVRETPGLLRALQVARQEALATRIELRRLAMASIEAAICTVLAHDPGLPCASVPLCRAPSDSIAWAASRSVDRGLRGSASTRERRPVFYWGVSLAAPSAVHVADYPDALDPTGPQARRVAEMRRRPRVREAADDEDDAQKGAWIIRPDEPHESVEDPFGLQRPADRDDNADPHGLGDALSDLPEARVVRTPATPKEILRTDDEHSVVRRSEPPRSTPHGVAYPEWDYRTRCYRIPGATVFEATPDLGDVAWVDAARQRQRSLIRRVRTRFERLRPRTVRIGRQTDGPELDIAEYVLTAAEARAGVPAEDRVYVETRRTRRELSVALLADVSASTDAWVAGTQRIIDVEKDALLVVLEALTALGDRHSVYAFSGQGPGRVNVLSLKRFAERTDDVVRGRVAALEADGYTRLGAAIRHVTASLSAERSERRLLLLISDGKPNDVDDYEGTYGVEDAHQAVAEAGARGVDFFCLTVDREAPRYAPRLFGTAGFAVLRRADQLPAVLVDVLRTLVRPRS